MTKWCFCLPALLLAAPIWLSGAVSISDDGATAIIRNATLTARIDKTSGRVVSMKRSGLELLSSQGIYWNPAPTAGVFTLVNDPAKNKGQRVEVSIKSSSPSIDLDVHYSLADNDTGLYAWIILNHRAGQSEFRIGEARIVVKLNAAVFDFLTVDAKRRRQMITGYDWVHGEPLNMKEARRMTTGIHKGEAEHKYDYSAVLGDTPAYGWTSTKQNVGIWIVNPAIEYLNCGPTHPELTGHIDLKESEAEAVPLLLNMWHGSHYGSRNLTVARDEIWNKVIGPFVVYSNTGNGHDGMWKDALARAAADQKAWPYAWVSDRAYPLASARGSVAGQLILQDPQAPGAKISRAWVGLAAPVDWQVESKTYQFWTRSDSDGRFVIRNVRPGAHTLYAFADGVLGEYSRADVVVKAGQTVQLDRVIWTPVRYGKQLWEIGVPDRSAAEFRHGDDYWHWGLYNEYPKDFPSDVNYTIGKSDWKRDWNYAQPTRSEGNGRYRGTTWTINFDLNAEPEGKGVLRLAIAGARGDAVHVIVNGQEAGDTGRLPDSGVMHRDGIRGYWCERDVKFAASMLKRGSNVIQLKWDGRSWVNGVLYDYLRLELDAAE